MRRVSASWEMNVNKRSKMCPTNRYELLASEIWVSLLRVMFDSFLY